MQRFPTDGLDLYGETSRVDRLEVLEGPTGRRIWSDREKARIVMESFRSGVRVCDVARQNGMAPQHLSMWRSQARKGKLPMPTPPAEDPFFAAVEVEPDNAGPEAGNGFIEITAGGVTVQLPEQTDAARIAAIAVALRTR
jgi:transposase